MNDQLYSKLISEKIKQFKEQGYDLYDIGQEESMVMNRPASHFKNGAKEQDAILHALALYEVDLYEFHQV